MPFPEEQHRQPRSLGSLPKHKAMREWRSCCDTETNAGKVSEELNTKSKQATNGLSAFICRVVFHEGNL